jgi:hypothetical protein
VSASEPPALLYIISVTVSVRILDYCPPAGKPQSIGVLAYCAATDALHVVFRDIDYISNSFDREYLQALSTHIASLSYELGPAKTFSMLDESLSNLLRISYEADVEVAENNIDAMLSEILRARSSGA